MRTVTEDKIKPLIAEGIELFGKYKPEALDWLTPLAFDNLQQGDWSAYVAIVRTGEQVSNEDKAAYGHDHWFSFARPCWDNMTDAGRHDPKLAVDEMMQHLFWRMRLEPRRQQLTELLSKPFAHKLYDCISIRAGTICCKAALGLSGMHFPIDAYPDLPLPECDQVWCKCDWKLIGLKRRRS